jgi:hypothetical protein
MLEESVSVGGVDTQGDRGKIEREAVSELLSLPVIESRVESELSKLM